jgi:hypothetical protein
MTVDGSGGTRTRNFQVKSPLLLPVELQTQGFDCQGAGGSPTDVSTIK